MRQVYIRDGRSPRQGSGALLISDHCEENSRHIDLACRIAARPARDVPNQFRDLGLARYGAAHRS
ncbi:hypothetical protein [Sphingobium yanoikuyae]|uniref:hypothetical protein n=1 Tax=Sphingobium yanoikuyae TaxID=13690 RepID=UPI0012D2BFC1|nr:hypothetical protein [Sphingobium yanoikuyae]